MKVTEELIVTEMKLDGFNLKVPKGFSELLNESGAWQYVKPECASKKKSPLENYERKVVLEEGKLRTHLTYKAESVKSKKIS